jgi:hypothetical protein
VSLQTPRIGMSRLHRRLRKLESQMTDGSGLVPHSEAWFQHWNERLDKFLTTGDAEAITGMPLAYVDDLLARTNQASQQSTCEV